MLCEQHVLDVGDLPRCGALHRFQQGAVQIIEDFEISLRVAQDEFLLRVVEAHRGDLVGDDVTEPDKVSFVSAVAVLCDAAIVLCYAAIVL